MLAAAGGTSAIDASDKSGFDIGYHMPMNANVNFFVRYGESETGVNFDGTAGSTETEDAYVWLAVNVLISNID